MATILRSSKYVRNFAELVNRLGVSKYASDVRVGIYQTQNSARSTLARSFATQVAPQKFDNESSLDYSLQKLDTDVKKYRRISRSKFEHILTELRKSKSVTSNQALMILRCCGSLIQDELPQSRSELVNEIWKSFENSGLQLDITHYNALLRVYIENNYAFSPAEILADLERKGIEPNKITYQRLITRYCEQGDMEGTSKILEFMKEKEIPVNENIFTALVKGHAVANDMTSAADILSVMQQAGLEPSVDTYRELLCGYAKHADMESITKTLSECRSRSVQLLDTDYLDIVSSLASSGHSEHIERILGMMPKKFGYLQECLSHIVKLIQAGHVDVAKKMLTFIPNYENGPTGSAAIKQLAKSNLPVETLLDLCKEIQSKGINSEALMIALEVTLAKGNAAASLALIEALRESGKEIREHYFWPVLVSVGRSEDPAAINDILRAMRTVGSGTISNDTLRDYVLPYKIGEPKAVLADLSTSGIPATVIVAAITPNLIMQLKLKEAAEFVQNYKFRWNPRSTSRTLAVALAQTRDVKSYVEILHHIYRNRFDVLSENGQIIPIHNEILEPYLLDAVNLIKHDNIAILSEVFEEMAKAGLQINDAIFIKLQKAIGREMTSNLFKVLSRLKYRRSVFTPASEENCREEIAKLEESLRKSFVNKESSIATQKRLLFLYSWIQDLPNLERLEKEFKAQEVPFNELMYKQLLDGYLGSNSVEKLEEYLRCIQLTNPNFQLNDAKLIKYVTSLVNNGRIEDTLNFLQEQIVKRGNSHSKNLHWKVLNALADLGNAEAINAVFDMFCEKEYIIIANPFLGPLVKVHIVRGDLETALNVFEKFCQTYQLTPYKNELAKKFIETEDAPSLQRLTDLSTRVHGEPNSLYDLAQSFIEMDCLRQAKKILEIPALHDKVHKLKILSKRFCDQGQTANLERLVKVIRDVPHLKELPEFYNDLLSSYVTENNWEKGLNLKRQMLDEDIQPSKIFLVTLAQMLKKNKQPIPYTVPQIPENEKSYLNLERSVEFSEESFSSFSSSSMSKRTNNENRKRAEAKTEAVSETVSRRSKESKLIRSLAEAGKLNEAYKVAENMMEDELQPEYGSIKILFRKLAQNGDIELLENMSKKLSSNSRKNLRIDFEICLAYIESEKISAYLDIIETHYEADYGKNSDQVVAELPSSGLRIILRKHPEYIERYTKFAENCAAKGILEPLNVLWIHYFVEGNPAADKIWSEHMINYPKLRYHSIIRSANNENNPELLEVLIKKLETSPVTSDSSKGHVYSELLELYFKMNNFEQSIDTLRRALTSLSDKDLRLNICKKLQGYLQSKNLSLPKDIIEKLATTDVTPDKVRLST